MNYISHFPLNLLDDTLLEANSKQSYSQLMLRIMNPSVLITWFWQWNC